MEADSLPAEDTARRRMLDSLGDILCRGALAGELAEFSEGDCRAAAEFIAACAARRPPGIALVRLESVGTQLGRRRMRNRVRLHRREPPRQRRAGLRPARPAARRGRDDDVPP